MGQMGRLGYSTTWRVLEAADYGVPQKRRRLFIVGTTTARSFSFPPPSHGAAARRRYRSASSVIGHEAPPGTPNSAIVTYALHPSLRPSAYHGHLYNGGGRPIELTKPAPTMLASMGGNKTPWVDTLGIVPEYHAHLIAGGSPRYGLVPGLGGSPSKRRRCCKALRPARSSPGDGPASTARWATPCLPYLPNRSR